MRVFFILFFVLFLLLIIPLNLKTKLIYNMLKNQGFVSVYFYKIKLLVNKWKFIPFKIVIENKKGKKSYIYFNKPNKNNSYKDIFLNQIIKKIYIKNFRTYANCGIKENYLATAIGVGVLKIVVAIFNCFLLSVKSASNLNSQIFCDFKRNKFFLCLTLSIQINLFAILGCLISSFFIKFCKEI